MDPATSSREPMRPSFAVILLSPMLYTVFVEGYFIQLSPY